MKYSHHLTTGILLVSVSSMPLSSCANMNRGEIMGSSAGIGAILGGVAGNLIGNDTVGTLIGVGAGALTGLIIGYVWSESIVEDRSAYATSAAYVQANNQQLNNRIREARKANRETSSNVSSIKKGNQKISKKDCDKQKAVMTQNINLMEKDIQTAKKAAKEASGVELQQLRSQINTLSAEKKQMEQNRSELSSLAAI